MGANAAFGKCIVSTKPRLCLANARAVLFEHEDVLCFVSVLSKLVIFGVGKHGTTSVFCL